MELYYFYTPLCGTCQVASKMIDVVEEHVKPTVVNRINLNLQPEYSAKYGVESVPCIVILVNGHVKQKIYAFHSVVNLIQQLKNES